MVGRLVLYLGAMYVLAAFISLSRSARRTGISLEEMLSRFFDELEAGYKSLIETATDAIVVFDSLNRVIIWNPTAEKMFGYSPSEAVADSLSCNPGSSLNPETDSAAQNPLDIIVRRKDLSTFPAEITLSRHRVAGSWVCTCIIRDLSQSANGRKRQSGRARIGCVLCLRPVIQAHGILISLTIRPSGRLNMISSLAISKCSRSGSTRRFSIM